MFRRARPSHLLLLTGFVGAACVYLFFLDPWGHDTWFHLQRLQDIERQFGRGQLYAHFAENAAQGKGLPVWIYYSQWVYWPAMLLRSLGAGPLVSLKIVYCAFLILTCIGCYRLLRLQVAEDEAALGTLLFATSNYVIGEIFQRSAYAEFLSVALLPPLLLALHRAAVHGTWRSGAALVLVASLMILFHPLSFMNAGFALAAYAVYAAIRWSIPYGRLLRVVPLFALALGLTAFYWLPAVIETRNVLGAEGVPTPFHETFLSVWRYVNFSGITTLGFVLTVLTPVVAGCLLFRRQVTEAPPGPAGRSSWPLAAGIIIYLALTLRISEPLYNAIPLLAGNLWVWRVLFPMTLLVVIFVTVNLGALPGRLRSGAALGALAGVAILQAAALVLWNTASDLSVSRFDVRTIERELLVESQRTDGFGVDEYLPHPRVLPQAGARCPQFRSVSPQGRYEMSLPIGPEDAGVCIHVPRYWNTRYAASIDGEATPVYANTAGEIVVVPDGRAGVATLRFTRPAYVTFSMYLSGAAAVVLIIGVLALSRRWVSRESR